MTFGFSFHMCFMQTKNILCAWCIQQVQTSLSGHVKWNISIKFCVFLCSHDCSSRLDKRFYLGSELMDLATFAKARWFLTNKAHKTIIYSESCSWLQSQRGIFKHEQHINETPQILALRDRGLWGDLLMLKECQQAGNLNYKCVPKTFF